MEEPCPRKLSDRGCLEDYAKLAEVWLGLYQVCSLYPSQVAAACITGACSSLGGQLSSSTERPADCRCQSPGGSSSG